MGDDVTLPLFLLAVLCQLGRLHEEKTTLPLLRGNPDDHLSCCAQICVTLVGRSAAPPVLQAFAVRWSSSFIAGRCRYIIMLSLRSSAVSRGDRVNLRKMMRESALAARAARGQEMGSSEEDDMLRVTHEMEWEQETRILACATVSTNIALLLMLAAVSTDFWLIVDYGVRLKSNDTEETPARIYSGVWRSCSIISSRVSRAEKICTTSEVFLLREELVESTNSNELLQDYAYTEKSFVIISVVIMLCGNIFGVYTIKRPRYLMKRISTFLHMLAGGSTFVCVEVFNNAFEHPNSKCLEREGSRWRYGFSFFLVWFVFIVYGAAFILFFLYSRNKKSRQAVPTTPPKAAECPNCLAQAEAGGRSGTSSEPVTRIT